MGLPTFLPDDERARSDVPGPTVGGEELTVGATVVRLASVPPYARSALVTVDTAGIRVTVDGRVPDTDTGHAFNVNARFRLTTRGDLLGLQAVRDGAADGVVQVSYFG